LELNLNYNEKTINSRNTKKQYGMKISMIAMLSMAALATACMNDTSTDREKTAANLERFVDSVETELSTSAQHNWAEIDREYQRLESNAEDAWSDATGEEKTRIDMAEERYEGIKADAEKEVEQMSAAAEKHVNNVEGWFERAAENLETGAENTGDAVEEGVEESMNWLEKNYENLEDGTKKQYDKLKERWNNDA
jgi:gas vesicle protein